MPCERTLMKGSLAHQSPAHISMVVLLHATPSPPQKKDRQIRAYPRIIRTPWKSCYGVTFFMISLRLHTHTHTHTHKHTHTHTHTHLARDNASLEFMLAAHNDGLLLIQPLDLVAQLWGTFVYTYRSISTHMHQRKRPRCAHVCVHAFVQRRNMPCMSTWLASARRSSTSRDASATVLDASCNLLCVSRGTRHAIVSRSLLVGLFV